MKRKQLNERYRKKVHEMLRVYFRNSEELNRTKAGTASSIQYFIKEHMTNSFGQPAKYGVICTKEVGMLLKVLHFTKNEFGVWSPPPGFLTAEAEA